MCATAGFGGAVGQQLASAFSNSISSHQQQKYAAAQHNQQISIAKRQMDDQYNRLWAHANIQIQEAETAQKQANTASTQSKMEIAREMLRAREEAKAAASGAGVAGNSLNRMITDISVTEQQKKAVVETNRENALNSYQMQKFKAVEGTRMSPMYYTEADSGGSFVNSMLGIVPSLLAGFNFKSAATSCAPRIAASCRR